MFVLLGTAYVRQLVCSCLDTIFRSIVSPISISESETTSRHDESRKKPLRTEDYCSSVALLLLVELNGDHSETSSNLTIISSMPQTSAGRPLVKRERSHR